MIEQRILYMKYSPSSYPSFSGLVLLPQATYLLAPFLFPSFLEDLSHCIPVPQQGIIASVVIPSTPAALFSGLSFSSCLTFDLRIDDSSWSDCLGVNWSWVCWVLARLRSCSEYSLHLPLIWFSSYRGMPPSSL